MMRIVSLPCRAPSFRLPTDLRAPVIMVGPGSGIAPLRSFWQHRQKQREMEESKDVEWGSMDLYAGCRAFEEDNIYQEEKQQLVNAGTLDHAFLALSREPGVKKVLAAIYVRLCMHGYVCMTMHV